ncbi:MAG: HEPN domain-containing protein [Thermoleophilia bacterium]
MRDLDHAALLLRIVADEYRALSAMVDPAVFNDAIFGFHAHQVAEKALKAWLSGLGVEYPRTHDLTRLLALVEAAGARMDAYDELVELNPFAVQLRYDAFEEYGEPLDRPRCLGLLRVLLDEVRAALDLEA